MGGRQNYDPFRGTLKIRCRLIIGIPANTRPPRQGVVGCQAQGVGQIPLVWARRPRLDTGGTHSGNQKLDRHVGWRSSLGGGKGWVHFFGGSLDLDLNASGLRPRRILTTTHMAHAQGLHKSVTEEPLVGKAEEGWSIPQIML